MKLSEKVIIFITVSWIINVPFVINKVLALNIGAPLIPYQYGFFIGLPLIFIILRTSKKGFIRTPYLGLLLILIFFFALFEYFNTTGSKTADYEYVKLSVLFYIFYIILLNVSDIGNSLLKYIIVYSIINILLLIFIIYLGYVGILNVYETKLNIIEGKEGVYNRLGLGLVIQPNGLSLLCSMGLALILFYREKYFRNMSNYLFVFIIVSFFGIIILNSSRGAFGIGVLVLILYYRKRFNNLNPTGKLVSVMTITSLLLIFAGNTFIYKLNITYRLIDETSLEEARFQQIYNSWNNFIEYPLSGVGWNYSAREGRTDYISSNFFYTQLPASSGILVFIIWLIYNLKLYYKKFILDPWLFLLFGFLPLAFYNLSLTLPTVIFACIVYIENDVNYSLFRLHKYK
jgi:hypothetical protein